MMLNQRAVLGSKEYKDCVDLIRELGAARDRRVRVVWRSASGISGVLGNPASDATHANFITSVCSTLSVPHSLEHSHTMGYACGLVEEERG